MDVPELDSRLFRDELRPSDGGVYRFRYDGCRRRIKSHLVQPDPQKKTKKSYDLNSSDFFWAKHAANPFPQVAEEIDAELSKCASLPSVAFMPLTVYSLS